MTWAYVFAMLAWAFVPGVKRSGKLLVPLILLLGILPDADLFLQGVGIAHRTVTHSIFFWLIIFVPVFYFLRLKSIPYFVALVQHFAFGDLLMGKVMVFWPLNSSFVGFNFQMPSAVDTLLETLGLVLFLVILICSGDLKRFFSVRKSNLLMVVPALALIISAVFFAAHFSNTSVVSYVFSSNITIFLALGHIILFSFLTISIVQGVRAFRGRAHHG